MVSFIFSKTFVITNICLINSEAMTEFFLQVYSHKIFQLYLPWVSAIIAIIIMAKLVTRVRMRKEGVVIVTLFLQFLLPVPIIKQVTTVEQVEVKKSKKKE